MSTEYIERGALINEIEKHFETIGANAQRLVARFPAADVEPVVRCEKCKHGNHVSGDIWKCSINGQEHSLKFFCAIGAHMDEGSDT